MKKPKSSQTMSSSKTSEPSSPIQRGRNFQINIVERGEMRAGDFMAHPLNARIITPQLRAALRTSLEMYGQIRSVLMNKRTGHVLDGHKRIVDALSSELADDAMVAYEAIDVDEQTEINILAILDPMAAMAGIDAQVFHQQLAEMSTDVPVFADMMSAIAEKHGVFLDKKGEPAGGDEEQGPRQKQSKRKTCPHCGEEL